ncbi:hypothetical protein OPQ81_009076 [Rhizoctonia solani]|nr:hypothetical protein OPQ81_009076 [Rhizoctonia solani]
MVVTRSRVLAKHIEAGFRSLIESTSIADKTADELAVIAEQYKQQSDPSLIEFDNELDLREDLPSRFSLLEDSHFPLFISFDKLCSLLEGDVLAYERQQKQYQVLVRHDNIIDYKKFQFEYWPKFKDTLKLGLDPAFVYSEFVGVIKGSSKAMKIPNGFLSRDEYLEAVARKSLNQLDQGLREKIYDMFEHYRKIKGERFERDPADRTRPLLKFVTEAPSQYQSSESWASKHSVDFLYVDEVQDNLMSDIHLLKSLCKSVKNTYWGGDTAQTIVAGSAFRIRDLGAYLFNEEYSQSSSASFGAQQAIIVRSESLVEELSSRLAELCPILSVTDCKGLEFDDVLLYNFFSSSDNPDAWDFVHGVPLKAYRNNRNSTPPSSLCGELKLLYVAITRARKRCWIWDHGHVHDAMQTFWLSQGLVTVASISEMTDWGTTVSTPKEWSEKGQEYFSNRMYRLAASCFKRGENMLKAKIAAAYHQMSRAKVNMLRGGSRESRSQLREAAKALDECAKDEISSGQIQDARHLMFHAATCLELAHEIIEAAKMFVKAGHHERAIRSLFGVGLMSDGLAYARRNNFRPQLKYLLAYYGRFVELAAIYLEERVLIDAVDCFLEDFLQHGRSSSLSEGARVAFGYCETVFGLESKKSAESLKCLRTMLDKLFPHTSSLQPKERKELQLFRDLLDRHPSIDWTLAESENWKQSDPDEKLRKIMLIHLALKDMSWLSSGSSFQCIQRRLNMWKTYISLIAPIIEAAEPSQLPAAQRLLAFRPSRPDLYINTQFIVSEESVVYECSKRERVPTQRSFSGDLLFPARWVDKLVKDGLRIPLDKCLRHIYYRLDLVGRGSFAGSELGTSTMVQLPSQESVPVSRGGYGKVLNTIMLGLSSISPVCHVPLGTTKTGKPSILELWIRRLFDFMYPGNGIIEEFDPTWVLNIQSIIRDLRTCIEQYLLSVDSDSTSSGAFSSLVIIYSLFLVLEDGSLGVESFRGMKSKSRDTILFKELDDPDMYKPSMGDYLSSFINWRDLNGLTEAAAAIRVALESIDSLDIALLVHLIEFFTCDMIFHTHGSPTNWDRFSGLILPFSWARLLAKRYCSGSTARDTSSLSDFVESIARLSDELKFNKRRNWVIGEKELPIRPSMVDEFNLRL